MGSASRTWYAIGRSDGGGTKPDADASPPAAGLGQSGLGDCAGTMTRLRGESSGSSLGGERGEVVGRRTGSVVWPAARILDASVASSSAALAKGAVGGGTPKREKTSAATRNESNC